MKSILFVLLLLVSTSIKAQDTLYVDMYFLKGSEKIVTGTPPLIQPSKITRITAYTYDEGFGINKHKIARNRAKKTAKLMGVTGLVPIDIKPLYRVLEQDELNHFVRIYYVSPVSIKTKKA